jgi:hypothetical protein
MALLPGVTSASPDKGALSDLLPGQSALVPVAYEPAPHVTNLAAHIRRCYEAARDHRQKTGVTDRLLTCQRQRAGEYDATLKAEIEARGGSKLFFNLTDTKCQAAAAWIMDVLSPTKDRPWALEPTPVPDLPEAERERIAVEVAQRAVASALNGFPPDRAMIAEAVQAAKEETLEALKAEAEDRAEAMAEKIEDQLQEGGFTQAFAEFVSHLCTYPAAILKGPVLTVKKRSKWGASGLEVTDEPAPSWYTVNPHDFYPGPNVRETAQGYLCERVALDVRDLAAQKGQEGWNEGAIDAVLAAPDAGGASFIVGDSERAALENRDPLHAGGRPATALEAVEFWGAVPARDLAEWGMPGVVDDGVWHEISALLVGEHVVRAILNPDRLGRRPYYVTSYEKVSGSLWGRGIPERMNDCQEAANACLRNALSNLAFASGPMAAVDIDAIPPDVDPTLLYPWRVIQYHGTKTGGREPVKFFQPQSNAGELLEVSEYFENKADDRTLIPRYAYGNDEAGGAGATASGLSMLMNSAAKGIKDVIAAIDRDVIRPLIEYLYVWNLTYLDDAEWSHVKGDCRVVARGAVALLIREQTQMRRQEFLNSTNNPTDLQIIGTDGRAAILRRIAQDLDMPHEEVVPSAEELAARQQAQQMLAAQAQTPMDAPGTAAPGAPPVSLFQQGGA